MEYKLQDFAKVLVNAIETAVLHTAARRSNLRQCRWVELQARGREPGDPRMDAKEWDEAGEQYQTAIATEILKITNDSILQRLFSNAERGKNNNNNASNVIDGLPGSPAAPTATPIPSGDHRQSTGLKRSHSIMEDAIGTPGMVAFVADMPQGGTLFRRVFEMTNGSGVTALLSAARLDPNKSAVKMRSNTSSISSDVVIPISITPSARRGSATSSPTRLTAAVQAVAQLSQGIPSMKEDPEGFQKGQDRQEQSPPQQPESSISRVKNLISQFESHATPKRKLVPPIALPNPALPTPPPRHEPPESLVNASENSAASEETSLCSGSRLLTSAVPASVQLWSARRDAARRMANIAEEDEEEALSLQQRATGTPTAVRRKSQETENVAPALPMCAKETSQDAISAFLSRANEVTKPELTESTSDPLIIEDNGPLSIVGASPEEKSFRRCLSADPHGLAREEKKRYVKMCLDQAPPPSIDPAAVIPVQFGLYGQTSPSSPLVPMPSTSLEHRGSIIAPEDAAPPPVPATADDPSPSKTQTPKPPRVQRMHRTLKPLPGKNWADQADLSDEEGLPVDVERSGLRAASWAKDTSGWHAMVRQQQDVDPRSIFGCGSREVDFKDLFKTPDFKRAETELKFNRNNTSADMTSFDARKDRCKKWNADKKHCGFAPNEGVSMTAVKQFRARVGQVRDVSHLVWDDWSVCHGNCQHDSNIRQPWYQKLELSPSTTPGFFSGRCGSPLPAARIVPDPELTVEESSTARREPDSFVRGIFCTTAEGWN